MHVERSISLLFATTEICWQDLHMKRRTIKGFVSYKATKSNSPIWPMCSIQYVKTMSMDSDLRSDPVKWGNYVWSDFTWISRQLKIWIIIASRYHLGVVGRFCILCHKIVSNIEAARFLLTISLTNFWLYGSTDLRLCGEIWYLMLDLSQN